MVKRVALYDRRGKPVVTFTLPEAATEFPAVIRWRGRWFREYGGFFSEAFAAYEEGSLFIADEGDEGRTGQPDSGADRMEPVEDKRHG
jgi:hypothetical protein